MKSTWNPHGNYQSYNIYVGYINVWSILWINAILVTCVQDMKDIQVVHKKQQTLHSSLTVLGNKVDEVSNTAQQLVDNGHYASPDISANVTSLKQKYVYMCVRRCSSCNTQDEELGWEIYSTYAWTCVSEGKCGRISQYRSAVYCFWHSQSLP